MFEITTDVIIGILYTLSLESVVLFFFLVFNIVPCKLPMTHKQKMLRVILVLSLCLGGGGILIANNGLSGLSYHIIFGVIILLMSVPLAIAFTSKKDRKQEIVVLNMKAEDYTLDTRTTNSGVAIIRKTLAYYQGKIIYFPGKVPSVPTDITAYCVKDGENYICTEYEVVKNEKKTRQQKVESVHTLIITVSAALMPLPITPMYLWYKENGAGDNPYMYYIVCFGMVMGFGFLRKMFKNPGDTSSKLYKITFTALYYISLLCLLTSTFRG